MYRVEPITRIKKQGVMGFMVCATPGVRLTKLIKIEGCTRKMRVAFL
jgi:hypothetical protein